jgi:hypothetical protein
MSNQGVLKLSLKDVRDQLAVDPDTKIDAIRLDGAAMTIGTFNLRFPTDQGLRLPAFPQARNLVCEVKPRRYRHCKTDIFSLTDGKVLPFEMRVVRNPKEWQAQFTLWNQLSSRFEGLKSILDISRIKVINGPSLGKFTNDIYDQITDTRTVMAKASMLNIFTKLMLTPEPIGGMHPWFSFIRQILLIDRERFFAIVDPEMGEIFKRILQNIDEFNHYKKADHSLHVNRLEQNLPGFRIFKSKIRSLKTDERHANLQFTLAPATDASGNDVLLLDVDIDEHGVLLNHLIDVILVHPINGGTHPFDVHEYLRRSHRNLEFGYELI